MGISLKPVLKFQYKICYSKIEPFSRGIEIWVRFQYKICYSKITHQILKIYDLKNFNTKFVIAK